MKRTHTVAISSLGFTVIEFVMVLVILFVIGAVTIPRFARAPDTTHSERVVQTAITLQSAISDIHTVWLDLNTPSTGQNLVAHNSRQIDTNDAGFPIGIHNNDRLTRAADCTHVWLNVLPNPPSAWHNEKPNPDYIAELDNGACRFRYRRVEGLSIVYHPHNGRVRVEAST